MRVTFEGTIHEILDQIEEFCSGLIKTTRPPKKTPKPKIEQPEPTPCQAHAVEQEKEEAQVKLEVPEDLLGAVMALVNGDKEKKAKLVAILNTYEAKTIGALGEGQRAMFWVEVSKELA